MLWVSRTTRSVWLVLEDRLAWQHPVERLLGYKTQCNTGASRRSPGELQLGVRLPLMLQTGEHVKGSPMVMRESPMRQRCIDPVHWTGWHWC